MDPLKRPRWMDLTPYISGTYSLRCVKGTDLRVQEGKEAVAGRRN